MENLNNPGKSQTYVILIIVVLIVLICVINLNNNENHKLSTVKLPPIIKDDVDSNEHFGISNITKVAKDFDSDVKELIDKNIDLFKKKTKMTNDKINLESNVLMSVSNDPPKSDVKRIQFPDDEDIINYDEFSTPSKMNEEKISKEINKKTQPIVEYAGVNFDDMGMLKRSEKINNIKFPICDENDDKINNDYDIDITELYRKQQLYVKSYLEDPIVRGYNLDSYENVAGLSSNTGLIKLDDKKINPKPMGYIFKTSPAYHR